MRAWFGTIQHENIEAYIFRKGGGGRSTTEFRALLGFFHFLRYSWDQKLAIFPQTKLGSMGNLGGVNRRAKVTSVRLHPFRAFRSKDEWKRVQRPLR